MFKYLKKLVQTSPSEGITPETREAVKGLMTEIVEYVEKNDVDKLSVHIVGADGMIWDGIAGVNVIPGGFEVEVVGPVSFTHPFANKERTPMERELAVKAVGAALKKIQTAFDAGEIDNLAAVTQGPNEYSETYLEGCTEQDRLLVEVLSMLTDLEELLDNAGDGAPGQGKLVAN